MSLSGGPIRLKLPPGVKLKVRGHSKARLRLVGRMSPSMHHIPPLGGRNGGQLMLVCLFLLATEHTAARKPHQHAGPERRQQPGCRLLLHSTDADGIGKLHHPQLPGFCQHCDDTQRHHHRGRNEVPGLHVSPHTLVNVPSLCPLLIWRCAKPIVCDVALTGPRSDSSTT